MNTEHNAEQSEPIEPTPAAQDTPAKANRRGPAARRAEAAAKAKADVRAGKPAAPKGKGAVRQQAAEDRAAGLGANAAEEFDDSAVAGEDELAAGAADQDASQGEPDWDTFADITSGRFDETEASAAGAEHVAPKRVLAPQADAPKLHKVLAQAGMGSRLEMERLIAEGRIWVNNEPAHVGQRIQFGDVVKVNGKPVRVRIEPPPARVIAYHKPEGEVVSHNDPQNRPTVFRSLPRLPVGKWQSVGRLDLNTEGLLLFTNSGSLANRLMHPRFGLQRQYAVRVLGALSPEEKQRLLDGVQLDDGPAQFSEVEDGGGEGANQWYRVTISEGRNREVRRMLEAVGHAVSRLIRIRYGAMMLPRGLRRGAWMELDYRDIAALTEAVGLPHVGHEVPPEARQQQQMRQERGRNMDRSKGGPRGSGGPLSQREQTSLERRAASAGPRRKARNSWGEQSQWGDREQWRDGGGRPGAERDPRDERPQGNAGKPQGRQNAQPDPLRTTQDYIGADSLFRQRQRKNKGSPGPRTGGNVPRSSGGFGGGRGGSGRSGGRRG